MQCGNPAYRVYAFLCATFSDNAIDPAEVTLPLISILSFIAIFILDELFESEYLSMNALLASDRRNRGNERMNIYLCNLLFGC